MKFRIAALCLAAAGMLALLSAPAEAQKKEVFIPRLVYRTGPYAPNGIPFANGYRDYVTLLNARDKGINGVHVAIEECEDQYDTKMGVECYEKLKNNGPKGAALVSPLSTGITYALIPKANVDKIPIHSMGYGSAAAGDGSVFPWVFTFPTSYWSQASAFVKYIGEKEGGLDKLKGKKITLVYHNSPYGKEPIPTLQTLQVKYGYQLDLLPVDHPGQEQGATWLQVRRIHPDWILLWGWGVMNSVSIKSATEIKFPMDHMMGVWWSGSEADVIPSGEAAKGYLSGSFHPPGSGFKVHEEILKNVYKGDIKKAEENKYGEVLYNRGIVNAMYDTEAIRTAMGKYGNGSVTGEQVRWGFENLDLTQAKLDKLGFGRMVRPIKLSCSDHEGNGPVELQQWNGRAWILVTGWIEPMRDVVRPMIEAAATQYAKENNITPRPCS